MPIGPEEMLRQVMEQLQVTGDRQMGYGWKSRVNRVLEKSSGYLSHAMAKGNLSLRTFFEVVHFLGKDLPEFMLEAGASGRTWSPLARLKAHGQRLRPELPPAVCRVAKALRASFGHEATPLGEKEKKLIDEVVTQRFVDPREAARLAEATLEVVLSSSGILNPGLALPMLAEWASARRRSDDPDSALCTLLACLEAAEKEGDLARRGDLLQRLALCYSNHFDDYEGALTITHEALSDHSTIGNMIGVGRSLVDRGIWYFHLRQHQASIAALQGALEVLPPSEHRHRYSSFEYMALNYRALRLPTKMRGAIEKAATFDVEPLHNLTLVWLEGSIAAEEKRFHEAAAAFEHCRRLFSSHSPVNAALVSLELVDVYLENMEVEQAYTIAREMFHLVEPLERFPEAARAVAQLVSKAACATVSAPLLRSTRATLLEARAPKGARAPLCA